MGWGWRRTGPAGSGRAPVAIIHGACPCACAVSGAMLSAHLRNRRDAAVVALASLSSFAFGWDLPSARQLLLLVLAGVLVGFAEYFMIEAFRHAEVTLVAPFIYTSPVWASLVGFLVFGTDPAPVVIAGAALIIASGLYLFHAETGGGAKACLLRRRGRRG